MSHYILIAALAWFAYGATDTHAQGLYKWVDSRGGVHYTNTPTNNKARTVDDALPPASNFKSPTPPEPAKSADDAKGETATTPNDNNPEQTQNAATPPQTSEQ